MPDGTRLHFDKKSGYLVGDESIPNMIVYKLDESNHVKQEIGYAGQKPKADIKFEYKNDRIIKASGSNGKEVKYNYPDTGELLQTIYSEKRALGQFASSNDVINYEYKGNFLTAIKHNDETVAEYNYNDMGQLISEVSPSGMEIKYDIQTNENGHQIITSTKQEIKTESNTKKKSFLERIQLKNLTAEKEEQPVKFVESQETMIYDQRFRPIKQISADGQTTEWNYSGNDFDIMKVSQPEGYEYEVKQSKDRKKLVYALPDIAQIEENYNAKGQLTSFKMDDDTIFKQDWIGPLLYNTVYNNYSIRRDYDTTSGLQKGILVTPPGNNTSWNRYVAYNYNETGNVQSVEDYSGMKTQFIYDENDEVKSLISNLGRIEISRNDGLINKIQTSWGDKINYSYNTDGLIQDIKNSSVDGNSLIKFNDGLISTIYKNNKIQYSIDYYPDNEGNLVKRIKTPVNDFEYNYDENNRLKNVICNNKYEVSYIYDDNQRVKHIRIYSL